MPQHQPAPTFTRRTLLAGAGVAGLAAALAGCTSAAGQTTPSVGAVAVTDQRGRRVTLPHPAQRIVTIPQPAPAMLVAVDQGASHVAGMHQASWAAIHDGVLGQYFPSLLTVAHDVAAADFTPNVESVLALHPDVVVQWGDQGTGLTTPLENAGLTVVGLSYGTQQDLTTWITLFATLLGKPDRGTAVNAAIAASLREMAAVGKAAPGPAPKVVYFNRFVGGLKVAAAGTYNDFCIRLVGATNPATDPGTKVPGKGMVGVDVEQVLAWDPDIFLLGNFDAAVPADVYGDPVWRGTSAVRSRRVYKVPLGGYRWDPPSHESPLMWRWLSMVAFPAGPPFDLRAEVERYYQLYYARSPSATQLDAILRTTANATSASYSQFDAG